MKFRIGSTVTHTTLLLISYFLNMPSQFILALTLMTFSPVWIVFLKFVLALIENSPKVNLSYIITYVIATLFYFYKYGLSFISVVCFVYGLALSILVIYLYDYVFNYLNNEGVRSYRWKALLSYSLSTTIGVIFLLLFKATIFLL